MPLVGQPPVYDDLVIESDSITKIYKPAGKNFVLIKSKRGTGGVNKTPGADSIHALDITDIVLVFSEYNESAIARREDHNRERWENLLTTYPEFFQFNTNYKSLCQCNSAGDSSLFRPAQGFYIYYAGKEPAKVEEPKAVEKKIDEPKVADKKVEDKKSADKETSSTKKDKEKAAEVKKEESVAKENKSRKEDHTAKKEEEVHSDNESHETTATVSEKPKKTGLSKPRRTKDPKACRPPCYANGDDDLNAFFKENVELSKKQKRHKKDLVSVVKLQINFDGSIKKTTVTGINEVLNQQVTGAIKLMNNWNPAVKSGVTVKSEIKMTLKYDKAFKGLKPFELTITPRLGPKCPCASDSELFGD